MIDSDLIKIQEMLTAIKSRGWIENRRTGNVGGIGNTLEDLLGISENNSQLPDFGKWELKTQRVDTNSLLTLFHLEPEPRTVRMVSRILLPNYGWAHQEAGIAYPLNERSFRQTINAKSYSDRGFRVAIDQKKKYIYVSFNFANIADRHNEWRLFIKKGVGIGEIAPTPFWSFDTIKKKLKDKINNLLYFRAERTIENGKEFFKYNDFEAYMDIDFNKFIKLIEKGCLYIDFDARTGHNHGTKFRVLQSNKKELYCKRIQV